jgi:hypothetical protein
VLYILILLADNAGGEMMVNETAPICSVARCDMPFPAPYKIYLDGKLWDRLCVRHGEAAKKFLEGELV